MFKVALIIPCYNESASIGGVIAEIRALPPSKDFSIMPIVINDCSTDNTLEIIEQLKVNYLSLPVNLGIGGAVQTGFKYAREHHFDMAIQLDGDGQHPVTEIRALLEPIIRQEADVVIGSRFLKKEGYQSTWFRRFGINYFKGLNGLLTGFHITDSTSGFRALNRKALELVAGYYPDEYPEPEAIILYRMSGLRIHEIPVSMRRRQGGTSSIHSYKSMYYMVKVRLAIIFIYLRLRFHGKHSTL